MPFQTSFSYLSTIHTHSRLFWVVSMAICRHLQGPLQPPKPRICASFSRQEPVAHGPVVGACVQERRNRWSEHSLLDIIACHRKRRFLIRGFFYVPIFRLKFHFRRAVSLQRPSASPCCLHYLLRWTFGHSASRNEEGCPFRSLPELSNTLEDRCARNRSRSVQGGQCPLPSKYSSYQVILRRKRDTGRPRRAT
jgi:hypothetical protein